MLYQIATLLLDVIGGLLTGACLLRLYMQWQRVPFSNPVGALVFALTDWFILPLRRLIPPTGRWDVSSLVGALLVQQVQYGLLWLIAGGAISGTVVPLMAAFGLMRVAISGLIGLLIVHAILSWVQTRSPISGVILKSSIMRLSFLFSVRWLAKARALPRAMAPMRTEMKPITPTMR